MSITIKNDSDIEKMRVAGRLASEVLDFISGYVKPNITTEEIDRLCHDYMVNVQKTIPAPLNYAPPGHTPYPKSVCTSVNNQICHGIPGEKLLKKGDIVNIDITVIKDGYHGDTSRMFYVGEPSIQAKRLCNITYECMWYGIKEVCGHGIGQVFHEDPQVLHYGKRGHGLKLEAGMIFTIEPMINAGKKDIKMLPDGWTVVTKDRSLSAQWEHTILVTSHGYEVLTISDGNPKPPSFV
jgi:methionyl aminopeptidase